MPLLAIHGDRDASSTPRNADALVAQYLRSNGYPEAADAASSTLPVADPEQRATLPDGRTETIREWRRDGHLVVRHVEVGGLGHAWSSGDASLKYNEAGPPDATALVGEFFTDAVS